MITLPLEWKTYYNAIRDRCRALIEYKIWEGIDVLQFDAWRNNFKTDEERYFSACVLDSLIYRSNKQTYSLIEQILTKNLNNQYRLIGDPRTQLFPFCLTQSVTDPQIRLVPAITPHDPVTKSSNEILRFMKRHFQICQKWIINPWNIEEEIKKGVKEFIFIDDFLGTGTQFEDVIVNSNLGDIIKKYLIIYAPLAAHTRGLSHLNTEYPNLKITSSEKLDSSSHSFFDNYFPKEQDIAKAFYTEMLATRGVKLFSDELYGYGNLELTFAFEHAAPDNSLHVLHMRNDKWNPLFNR